MNGKVRFEVFWPRCDAEFYDVFPDGVCNYVSKSLKAESIGKLADIQKKLLQTARKQF